MQLTFNLTSNNFAKDIYLIIYTAFDVSAYKIILMLAYQFYFLSHLYSAYFPF